MSKPLELTIYPPRIPCSLWPECPIEFHEVDNWGPDKTLTDAELAAEYWRKNGDFESCAEGYSTANDGYTYESEGVEAGRLNTIRRFASLPHYDQEQL